MELIALKPMLVHVIDSKATHLMLNNKINVSKVSKTTK